MAAALRANQLVLPQRTARRGASARRVTTMQYKWTLATDKAWCKANEEQCLVAYPIPLWKATVVVGVEPHETDVILKETKRVSPRHAAFEVEGKDNENLFVRDLSSAGPLGFLGMGGASATPTAVDGKDVPAGGRMQVQPGSKVSLANGDIVFAVERIFDSRSDPKTYVEMA